MTKAARVAKSNLGMLLSKQKSHLEVYRLVKVIQIVNHCTEQQANSTPNLDPDAPEEGEKDDDVPMNVANDDDAAMTAMMGLDGFGSTKVIHSVRFVYLELSIGQASRR